MNTTTLAATAIVAVLVYFIARRWTVAHIYASLVAAEIANPQRAKWVEELAAKRERLEKEGLADSKEHERIEDRLAAINPLCVYGRRQECLLETAWEIYSECGWKTRRAQSIEV
jgi:hypothetical protein